MRNFWRNSRCVFALLALIVMGALPAKAQLTLNLNPAVYISTAGSEVTLLGVLTNIGETEIFLNGIDVSFSTGSSFFTLNTDIFNNNVPFSLAPGESYTTDGFSGPLVGVGIAGDTPPDVYPGSVTLIGGADGGTLEPLAQANFIINVTSASAPEPGTFALLGVGLGIVGLVARRAR